MECKPFTVSKKLNEVGYRACRTFKVPRLTVAMWKKRLAWPKTGHQRVGKGLISLKSSFWLGFYAIQS